MILNFEKLVYSLTYCTSCFLTLQVYYSTKGFLEKNRWCLFCPVENENTVKLVYTSYMMAFPHEVYTVKFLTCSVWLSPRPSRSTAFGDVSDLKPIVWGEICRPRNNASFSPVSGFDKKERKRRKEVKSSLVLWIIWICFLFLLIFTEMPFVMRFSMCWWKAGKST